MKLISNRALREFATRYPASEMPLQDWRRVVEKFGFSTWSDLKRVFRSVDKVGELAIFDIGGNKYRIAAYARFQKQRICVKAVMTHKEYDKGAWKP
ncbi:MAG: type II toxin-antitoxin system HigB family toxin [Candidatus Accumulibacter sp.]|jgi:mRNA interferase HigB|nr:type II toxin-antitoxin system HigB family toxin [Accumulibacter sp.]